MTLKQLFSLVLVLQGTFTFAQKNEVLIPYRSGNLWGLADTNLHIVVTPGYDSINYNYYDPKGLYRVMKDGKYGVISKDSIIIPPKLNEVTYRHKFIVDVVDKTKGYTVPNAVYYAQTGRRLLQDTIRYLKPVKKIGKNTFYAVLGGNGYESVFAYDHGKHVITTWLLEGKQYRYFYALAKQNKLYFFGEDSHGVEDVYEVIESQDVGVQAIKLDEIRADSIVESDMYEYDDVAIEEEPDYDYNSRNTREIQFLISDKQFYVLSNPPKSPRYSWGSRPLPNSKIDTVRYGKLPSKHFEMRAYNKFSQKASNNYYDLRSEDYNRRSRVASDSFIMYRHKKKLGVITEFGVINPVYDTIFPMCAQKGNIQRFIVGARKSKKSTMAYGLINANGDTLLELGALKVEPHYQYYRQKPSQVAGYFVTKPNNKQSYVDFRLQEQLTDLDSIIPTGDNNTLLILVNNERYGYHQHRKQVDPIFEDLPMGYRYFGKYKVLVMYDRDFNFLGFGKFNGQVFYEK